MPSHTPVGDTLTALVVLGVAVIFMYVMISSDRTRK